MASGSLPGRRYRERVSGFYLGYPTAFAAGIASFASPCVLPLVPGYLSFLAGVSYDEVALAFRDRSVSRRVFAAALAFVAGFVVVFVALGASATFVGRVLIAHTDVLEKVSGLLIVLCGLYFLGLLRVPMLQRDVRFHPRRLPTGPSGAFVMGLAFAFGWTPCVGPILATILALAAAGNSVPRGMTLLACYALGIGLPFLFAAVAFQPFLRMVARLRTRMRAIEVTAGALMVVTGVLITTGFLAGTSGWLLRTFPALGRFG